MLEVSPCHHQYPPLLASYPSIPLGLDEALDIFPRKTGEDGELEVGVTFLFGNEG